MMNDQNYLLFEEYCSGTLSEKDRKVFESRLAVEKELSDSFIIYKELSGFLKTKFETETRDNAFEDNLKAVSDAHFKTEKPVKVIKFSPWKYAVAASIMLLMGIFYFNGSDPIYSDFATHDTIALTVRGTQNDVFVKAENAFNNGDYKNASSYLKTLLKTDANNQELRFYEAITAIELEAYEAAEKELVVISEGNSVYKNNALWYLALSKLKQKKHKECKVVLETIPEDYEDYATVEKLLEKLE